MGGRGRIFSNGWLIAIVSGLIATIVGGVIVHDLTQNSHAPAATTGGATPTGSTLSSSRPSSPPSISVLTYPFTAGSEQLPLGLTGTWTGSVFQASTKQTYPVILRLARTPGETVVGTSSYPTLNCEGMLELNQVTFDTVVVTEYITLGATQGTGEYCINQIQIKLKYLDKNHLLYVFAYNGNPTDGQATLKRSSGLCIGRRPGGFLA
jgi:hypothetical protein